MSCDCERREARSSAVVYWVNSGRILVAKVAFGCTLEQDWGEESGPTFFEAGEETIYGDSLGQIYGEVAGGDAGRD